MSTGTTTFAVGLTLVLVGIGGAQGGVILQPAAASTDMGQIFPAGNVINQSGLSLSYSSLVTDFDAYIGSGPVSNHGYGANIWGGAEGVRSGTFTLGLGGVYTIDAMAFWDLALDPSAVKDFELLADDNPGFTSPTVLGTFSASNPGVDGGFEVGPLSEPEVFEFPATDASYVRLNVLDSWSGNSFSVAFSEVAFEVVTNSDVPEPTTMALLGLGALALIRRRSRR